MIPDPVCVQCLKSGCDCGPPARTFTDPEETPPAEGDPLAPADADKATSPEYDAAEGCCASCGAEYVPGSPNWPLGLHRCTPAYRGTFAASKRAKARKSQAAEGDPLAEMRRRLALAEEQRDAALRVFHTLDVGGDLAAALDAARAAVAGDLSVMREAEQQRDAEAQVLRTEVAKLRTRCRNQRRELRDQERRRERAVRAVILSYDGFAHRAEAAEAEVARLTEGSRRLVDMDEVADARQRAESAEAALTELVAADATTDAQRLQRAWSKARERVRK